MRKKRKEESEKERGTLKKEERTLAVPIMEQQFSREAKCKAESQS